MKKAFFLFILFSPLLNACIKTTYEKDKIKVNNKLPEKIICIFGYNYPDLKLNFTSKEALLKDSNLFRVNEEETKTIDTLGLCKKEIWKKYIKQSC